MKKRVFKNLMWCVLRGGGRRLVKSDRSDIHSRRAQHNTTNTSLPAPNSLAKLLVNTALSLYSQSLLTQLLRSSLIVPTNFSRSAWMKSFEELGCHFIKHISLEVAPDLLVSCDVKVSWLHRFFFFHRFLSLRRCSHFAVYLIRVFSMKAIFSLCLLRTISGVRASSLS